MLFDSAFGKLTLNRFPIINNDPFQAWDGADLHLLKHLSELKKQGGQTLIINDSFGSLTTSIIKGDFTDDIHTFSDSFLGHAGINHNLSANQVSTEKVTLVNDLTALSIQFDTIIIKVSKSLGQLEEQLSQLRPLIHDNTMILAGGMVKNIHSSTLQLFEKYLGPTKTSLAWKKSRLAFIQFNKDLKMPTCPWPAEVKVPDFDITTFNHGGIFSAKKLDIGTRFLLENLTPFPNAKSIIDLGCGNGILGTVASAKSPDAEIIFTDDSFAAILSAQKTYQNELPNQDDKATFLVTDRLQGIDDNTADVILCNPPFHQQQAVTTQIALSMFEDASRVLSDDGEFWVVANKHLGYKQQLRKLFGNVQEVSINAKFVVLRARNHI